MYLFAYIKKFSGFFRRSVYIMDIDMLQGFVSSQHKVVQNIDYSISPTDEFE